MLRLFLILLIFLPALAHSQASDEWVFARAGADFKHIAESRYSKGPANYFIFGGDPLRYIGEMAHPFRPEERIMLFQHKTDTVYVEQRFADLTYKSVTYDSAEYRARWLAAIDSLASEIEGKIFYATREAWLHVNPCNRKESRIDYLKAFAPYRVVSLAPTYDMGSPIYLTLSNRNLNRCIQLQHNLKGGYFLEDLFTESDPRKEYKWSASTWKLIEEGKVKIGMSREQVRLSWGEPKDINSTITRRGTSEQWVYSGNYLYFENGKLTTIQD
jgi:hypothetical protein